MEKAIVETFKVDYDFNHPLPWMFKVHYKGKTHNFAGIPNQCHSKRSAAIRGWWRARWLMNETYDQRYVYPNDGIVRDENGMPKVNAQ